MATDIEAPWSRLTVPPEVSRIPSMLSAEEQQYLIWLAAEQFQGWGAMVELGVWLGSSSAALAEGLRRRNSTAIIRSFDLFRWEQYMTDAAGPLLEEGDDFLPLYLRQTAAFAPWIQAEKLDLMQASWNGGPIEILFVDSAKNWELTNAVLAAFARHLVPGRSRIVLQDFRYHYAYCLPLIFYSRPDLWKQVEDVPENCTVTFMPLMPLDGPSGVRTDYSDEDFPFEIAERLLKERMTREGPVERGYLQQSLYRKCLIDGPMNEALKLRAQLVAEGIDEHHLAIAEDPGIIQTRGWKAFLEGNYESARADAERCLAIPQPPTVYSLTLLGFALLRLGDHAGTRKAIERILALDPNYSAARLLKVELALDEQRYQDAAAEALAVLKASSNDESTTHWSLTLLFRAWEGERTKGAHATLLEELAPVLGQSPSFVTHLAAEQYEGGQRHEARETLGRALALRPDYPLAVSYRDTWSAASRP